MIEPRRLILISDEAPQKFVDLGNGKWYYNYDIKSEVVNTTKYDGEEVTETRWNYIQIKLGSRPEYKKCVETLIREYITQSQEFDLINTSNRALLGKEEAPSEYLEYLNLLDEIKTKVKADFGM